MDAVWLSYRLADFIMFSARVYDRQLELHNESLAGMQVVSLALSGFILWQAIRPSDRGARLVPVLLGVVWIWVAWSFLWSRFAEINLLASYAAPAFGLQGLALLATGLSKHGLGMKLPDGAIRLPAISLLAIALLLYPLLAPALGRPLATAEFFAMMPDPTAVGTLAILAISARPLRWPLMIIPLLWCLCSAATYWVLGSVMIWVVTVFAAGCLALAIAGEWLKPDTQKTA